MSDQPLLTIDGAVDRPVQLTADDMAALSAASQIPDVGTIVPGRRGTAITLRGLLELVNPHATAKHLTLHASKDNFHASVPLDQVRERAFLIYRLNDAPLSAQAGGPFRFFVPDHLSCRSAEIDECANVKFVDRIELSHEKGFDNRPHDDAEHAKLHAGEH